MTTINPELQDWESQSYKYGFTTEIESETLPPGLDEDVIRHISAVKGEPEWLTEWRLKAYRNWLTMKEPTWQNVHYPPIDFQKAQLLLGAEEHPAVRKPRRVDPELLRTYERLGIPLEEQKRLAGVAVDAVFDSVSVATTFKEGSRGGRDLLLDLRGRAGAPGAAPEVPGYGRAAQRQLFRRAQLGGLHGRLVRLRAQGRRSVPMELSTYFRINAESTGQFERTLIIAEEGASVSYLEGCTAPMRDENQLHAAVVELVALDDAKIKYSTIQNWYPGRRERQGRHLQLRHQARPCKGRNSHISWTQVETGSAITWKYPSCVLEGDNSIGEFYSVALSKARQQIDSGTKMVHLGKNTRSTIVSKGISAQQGNNTYRGLVKIGRGADGARNYTQCDSLLMGNKCGAHTFPYIDNANPTAHVEHEATTSKVGEDQLFYLQQRGLTEEQAVSMIVNGFCREVFRELPMEFAVEATKLLEISLEGSVG